MFEDWGAISRKRCMIRSWCQQMTIGNHPSFMLYRMAPGHLWHSVTEKSKITLASYGRPTLPKLSPYYCALHFALSWEAPRKSWGRHNKFFSGICAPTFEMLPAPLVIASRNSDPPSENLTNTALRIATYYVRPRTDQTQRRLVLFLVQWIVSQNRFYPISFDFPWFVARLYSK